MTLPVAGRGSTSPLTADELAVLESTLLPALERHHLRLLAHALRTLQAIAGRDQGQPPARTQLQTWAADQIALAGDPDFARTFLDQLEGAAGQLDGIAAELHTSPLALTLEQLSGWAKARADARLQQAPNA